MVYARDGVCSESCLIVTEFQLGEDENISGDGWWGRLHNINVLNATEQYTLK